MKTTWRARIYRLGYPLYNVYRRIFHPKNTGACGVIEYQGKILLIRNTYGDGSWNFPGGGIKKNENPIDAAIRETHEEVGIVIKSVTKIGELLFDANNYDDTIHVFYAVAPNNNFKIDPNEILEAKWFPMEKIPLGDLSRVGSKIFKAFQESEVSK